MYLMQPVVGGRGFAIIANADSRKLFLYCSQKNQFVILNQLHHNFDSKIAQSVSHEKAPHKFQMHTFRQENTVSQFWTSGICIPPSMGETLTC